MSGKIDIGNVRGIKGDKGEKGEQGKTPSYDDLRYQKQGDNFVTLKGTGNITQSDYYIDVDGNLCDSEGHIYDNQGNLTNGIGNPFDYSQYGYYYMRLWVDGEGRYCNSNGELLDENWEVQYVVSDFVSDIASFIYDDEEGYNQLVGDIAPNVALSILTANPSEYRSFFDEIEGDIKYYICVDNPRTSITLNNSTVTNTCKYYDENGNIAKNSNNQYIYVPLEKNALYLYNGNGYVSNDVMLYDIYLCTKAGTVPKKLVDSGDFVIDYNVIDGLSINTPNPSANEDERRIVLEILTRGTRGQFYSMDDVDTLLMNNLINKLGANNGIAQLNASGKVPSSQLPAYIDDVVEGTMNAAETTFTPSNNDYIDSVRQTGKIYVDTNTRKTYRWTGSTYIMITNPIVVDDGSTTAYSSTSGSALATLMGNTSLNTTATTVTGAVNELNTGKENVSNKTTAFANTTNALSDAKYPTEKLVKTHLDLKVNISDVVDNLTTDNSTKVLSAKQGKKLQDEKLAKNQGSGNSGKFLKVGSDGNVSLESVTSMTPSSHNHGNIDNNGVLKISGTAQASKNVVTDSSGNITVEDKSASEGAITYVSLDDNLNLYVGYDPIVSITADSTKNVLQSGETCVLSTSAKTNNNVGLEGVPVEVCERFAISNIDLTADKSIVQSGTDVSLSAKLKTSSGGVPNNVSVLFKNNGEIWDTVQTDSSGVASKTFVSSGSGENNITVECDSVQSGTYTVYDCTFKDIATTGQKSNYWRNNGGWTVGTPTNDGTHIVEIDGSKELMPSTTENATSWNNRKLFNVDFALEFDISNIVNYPKLRFYLNNTYTEANLVTEGHLKFLVKSTGITRIINDGEPSTIYSSAITTQVSLGFVDSASTNSELTFKNFKIYPI